MPNQQTYNPDEWEPITGQSPSSEGYNPDEWEPYAPAMVEPETEDSEADSWNITRGLKSGLWSTAGVVPAVGAMAAKTIGWQGGAKAMSEAAQSLMERAEQYQPDTSFGELIEDPSLGGAVDWALFTIGNFAPSMAVGFGGAAAGVKVATKLFLKNAIKKGIAKGLTKEAAAKAVTDQVMKKVALRGAQVGIVGAVSPLEGGHMFMGDVERHGIEDASVSKAVALGGLAGLVELGIGGFGKGHFRLIEKYLGKAAKETAKKQPHLAIRMLNEIAYQSGGEAFQELTQEELAILHEAWTATPEEYAEHDHWSRDNWLRRIESGLGGGLMGLGGAATPLIKSRPSAARDALLDEDEQDVTAKELLTGEKEEPSAIDTFTGEESLEAEEAAAAMSDEGLEVASAAVTEPKGPTAPKWLNDLTDTEISKRIDNFEKTQAARGLSAKQTQNLGMLQQELENRGLPAQEAKEVKKDGSQEGEADKIEPAAEIEAQAHEAATSPLNETPEPTEAQIEAGNYKKGHVKVQGFDISIENPEGSQRSGTAPDGKKWSITMSDHYGYFKRSEGKDGEQIDVFVNAGTRKKSDKAYIVDQIDPKTGKFDEHKIMLGYSFLEDAREGYLANYEKGWKGLDNITEISIDKLKNFIQKRQNKPYKPAPTRPTAEVAREPVGVEAKESWEMTWGEQLAEYEKEIGRPISAKNTRPMQMKHLEDIKQALSEGKPVPESVLAEYPDLKPVKEAVPEKVEKAEVPEIIKPKLEEKYGRFLEKVGKRLESEAIGQNILDTLEEKKIKPTDVSKTFWENTFFKLPGNAQDNITKYLTSLTGMKPGDVIATIKGKEIKSKDWMDIAQMVEGDFSTIEHLEGTERGYISLMAYANEQVEIEPAKPLPPKPPEAKPPEAVREEIKGEVTPEVAFPKTYEEIEPYLEAKTKEYGSRNKYFASDEYKKDYPKINELTTEHQKNLAKKAARLLKERDLSPSDNVEYVAPDGSGAKRGNLYLDKNGIPKVKVHTEIGLQGKVTVNKTKTWNIGWKKVEPVVKKPKIEIKPTGAKKTVYLPDNTPIEASYAVVDSEGIISSHDNDLKINPAFPKELQPRDRGRKAMALQVSEMAQKLNPERLGDSTGVGSGAPIVGKDGTVESGNGRVIAIRKAYVGKNGKAYKQWLIDNAETFGLKPDQIKDIKNPVLVRVRETDVDRVDFVKKANQDEIARMSPVETAKSDADRLTESDIAIFAPSEEGNIAAASNHAFINRFIKKLGTTEAAGFLTEDGKHTKQLIDRITAAIFYKAYQSNDLITMMAEESDPNIKNILNALTVAAPEYVKTRALNATLGDTAIVDHIVGAAQIINNTRNLGQTVEQFFKQMSMFEQVPEYTKEITLFIDKNKRSTKRQGEFFKRIAKQINDVLVESKNIALPGMKHRDINISEIIDDVIQQVEAKYEDQQRGLFAQDIEKGGKGSERTGYRRTEAGLAETGRGEVSEAGTEKPGAYIKDEDIEHHKLSVKEAKTKYKFKQESLDFSKADILPTSIPKTTRPRIRMATTGYIAFDGNIVRNSEDAAALLAPIRKSAQEYLYGITTDKNGVVLEIHEYTKGTTTASQIRLVEFIGHVLTMPEAKSFYHVHNHPSADFIPSPADYEIGERIESLLQLNGIKAHSLVIGGTKYTDFTAGGTEKEGKSIRPTIRKIKLPVRERKITKAATGTIIKSSADVAKYLTDSGNNHQDGFVLLDAHNKVVEFMPYPEGMEPAKATTMLLSKIDTTGAMGMVFNSPNKSIGDEKGGRREFLKRFLEVTSDSVTLHDIINQGHSLAEQGLLGFITPARDKIGARPQYSDSVAELKKLPPLFKKRATATSIGVFKAPDLQSQINKITTKWENSPEVEVIQSQSELPENIQSYVKEEEETKKETGDLEEKKWIIDGTYYHGKVYIVADNMASVEAAVKTLVHESFGHYGLRGMLGNDFSKIMRDVYLAKRQEVQKIADEYEYDIKTEKGKVLSAEEWLAREAVNNPTSGWVKRVMIAIRKFARRLMPSLRLSDAEIYQIIEDARNYVVRGRPRMSDGLGAYFGVPGYQSDKTGVNQFAQDIKFSLKKAIKKITDNPNFVKWFGDSVVKDKAGNPLTVYHGTQYNFDKFEKRKAHDKEGKALGLGWGRGVFYFSSSAGEASQFAFRKDRGRGYTEGQPSVMPVYLSIKNPFDVDKNYGRYQRARDGFMDTQTDIYWGDYPASKNQRVEAFVKQLKKEGFDGIVFGGEYTAFEPTQIKSIYNTGAFGITEKDIMFQMAGKKAMGAPEIKIIGKDKTILNRISPEVTNFLKTMSAMDVYIVPRTTGKYGYVGRGMQDRPQDIHIGPKALKDDAELNATIFHEALHQIESGRWNTPAAMDMKSEWESFDWKSKSPKELRELGFGDTLWFFRKTKVKALKSGEFFAEMGEYYLERPKILEKQAKPIFDFFEKHVVKEAKMFSTKGDDIQFSKRKIDRLSNASLDQKTKQGIADTKKMTDNPSSPEGFNMPSEGRGRQVLDTIQWKMQDRLIHLKKVQTAIETQESIELPDDANVYQTEELYHYKTTKRINNADRDLFDPLIESIHNSKHDLEDVELFLRARHAPEANKRLQEINPKRENNTALSGMSNGEAGKIIGRYGKNPAMLRIAEQIDAITKATRQMMVGDGLATKAEIKAWENAYKHYIPLKREKHDLSMPKKGRGMYVGGKESKKRLVGSEELKPINIVANIMAQHESTIIRAEKAKVGRAMLKLAKEYPNKEFWTVDAPELKPFLKQRSDDARQLDLLTGLPSALSEVVYGRDILYKFNDNVLVTKIDGVEHTITFNDQNVHSQRIVKSLKNLGADNSNAVINVLSKINRILAIVNTSANPEFILSNFARDIQTAGYNINDTEAKYIKKEIFKDVFKALWGIRHGVRGKYDIEWAKHYEAFEKAGAQTGWIDYYKNIEAREKTLKKKLALLKDGKWPAVQRAVRDIFDFVSSENTAVENAIRLSTYKHLTDIGVSDAKAASAAKNLTVNFNRRGDAGQALNALYLFFNANAQGSVRLIYAASRSPAVRKLMLGTVGFAVMLDILNRAIGGDDDDGEKRYDKVPDWVKEHNLVIMRPNGDYFKIPLPWGYNTLHVLGQIIGESVDPNYKKDFSPIASAGRLGGAVLASFNPLGSESSLLQLISPTVIDPFIQWAENENFAGIPLRPEQNPFDVPKPEYQMYFRNAREPSKWIAKKLNDLTGGDATKPGLADVSPEVFDLFIDTFTGGAGKFLDNTLRLPKTLSKEDVDVRKIPFIRRMYGEPSEFYLRTKFYDNLSEIRYAEKSIKHYKDIDDREGLKKAREANKDKTRFAQQAISATRFIKDKRSRQKGVEKSKLPSAKKELQIEEINQQIRQKMTLFNRRYLKKEYMN